MTLLSCPTCGQHLPDLRTLEAQQAVEDPLLALAGGVLDMEPAVTVRRAAEMMHGTTAATTAQLERARRVLERAVRAGLASRTVGTVRYTGRPLVTYHRAQPTG